MARAIGERPARLTLAAFDPKDNSGRALYFVFAVAVVLSHAFVLGGFDQAPRFQWSNYSVSFGTVGVAGFFVLGGFLITGSVSRRPLAVRFLWMRCARLLPMIWISLLSTAFVLAPLSVWYRTRSLDDFHGSDAWSFVVDNAFLAQRQWTIGDTLSAAPFPVSWNGSLWTMASLFLAYLMFAALVGAGLLTGRRWLAPAATLLVWVLMAVQASSLFDIDVSNLDWVTETWQATLLGPDSMQLISLFMLGSTAWLYRTRIPTGPVAVLLTLAVLLISFVRQEWHIYGGLAWAFLALVMLVRLPVRLSSVIGSVPFGIYVWAFPVEQFAALCGLAGVGYPLYAACCLVAVCLSGIASYRWVEQPTMRLTRRLTQRADQRREPGPPADSPSQETLSSEVVVPSQVAETAEVPAPVQGAVIKQVALPSQVAVTEEVAAPAVMTRMAERTLTR